MTYSGFYLRRTTAEAALRTCHRRGWEPSLRRRLGVWVVEVRLEAPAAAPPAASPVPVAARRAA